MARWKLKCSHYLRVRGVEWEQKEVDRTSGKEERKRYEVPALFDTNDPTHWNVQYRGPSGQVVDGEIHVSDGVGAQPKDIIFRQEFEQLEKENPNFKFLVTCTRATPEDNWTGRTGRVTPEWIKEIATDLPNTVFYACGPNALVDFAEQLVVHGLGLPKEQMKTEKWG